MRNELPTVLHHYMPYWLGLALVVLRCFATGSEGWETEMTFAVLTFWIWALSVNAGECKLARSGGREPGTQTQRKKELASIVFFGLATVGAYIILERRVVEWSYGRYPLAIGSILVPGLLFLNFPDIPAQT